MRHKTLKTDFEKKATPPKRRLSHVLAASLGAVFMTAAAPQEAQAAGPPFSAIVMDANTGKTLHDRDKDKRIYPASTTKMMTALLTFEALRAGRLTPDQELNVSRNAAGQPSTNLSMMTSAPSRNANGKPRRNKKGKIIYVSAQKTKKITVEDALDGLMVRSANDAAVVLAGVLALGGGCHPALACALGAVRAADDPLKDVPAGYRDSLIAASVAITLS